MPPIAIALRYMALVSAMLGGTQLDGGRKTLLSFPREPLVSDWRQAFGTRLGPPISLCGITFGDWLRVLRHNRFAVDVPNWPRAISTTTSSLINSVQRWYEQK